MSPSVYLIQTHCLTRFVICLQLYGEFFQLAKVRPEFRTFFTEIRVLTGISRREPHVLSGLLGQLGHLISAAEARVFCNTGFHRGNLRDPESRMILMPRAQREGDRMIVIANSAHLFMFASNSTCSLHGDFTTVTLLICFI